jgi:hypothetical protein
MAPRADVTSSWQLTETSGVGSTARPKVASREAGRAHGISAVSGVEPLRFPRGECSSFAPSSPLAAPQAAKRCGSSKGAGDAGARAREATTAPCRSRWPHQARSRFGREPREAPPVATRRRLASADPQAIPTRGRPNSYFSHLAARRGPRISGAPVGASGRCSTARAGTPGQDEKIRALIATEPGACDFLAARRARPTAPRPPAQGPREPPARTVITRSAW